MTKAREQWGTGTGFVLATIGSAVGLGNIWRFSYVAGENGGGAFLIVYLLSVVLVGLPIVIGEMALGRYGRGDAVAAFAKAAPRSLWRHAGWLPVAGCLLILSFYGVIAGWALKYFVGAATGALWQEAAGGFGGYFQSFIANRGEPLGWQLAMMVLTMLVVAGGVRRGIEGVNRYLMPLLALCVVALAVYSATLEGASAGWRFLFVPDWGALSQSRVLGAAVGQAFFSLGVGMAVFITYASYLKPDARIPRFAVAIVAGDTLFALVAGLAIFPAVFAFGMDPQSGPQLAFITLPQIFLVMPGGPLVGIAFFGLLVAAALTSMVSLLEVPVAAVIHRTGIGRRRAVLLIGVAVFVIGIPSALSFGVLADVRIFGRGVLDAVDAAVSNYLLPIGGILVCLHIGWYLKASQALEAAGLSGRRLGGAWLLLLRFVAPATIAVILWNTVIAP
ncbi:MAG: sodium-dependent transporter [Rhodospirillaceae bacterium]